MKLHTPNTLAFLAALVLIAAPALASWQVHSGANVRFNTPDGWRVATQGNMMVTRPPQGGIALEFFAMATPAEVLAADRSVTTYISREFQQVRVTRPARPIVQNGLRGVGTRGVGLRDGRLMEWFAVALGANGRGIIVICFALQGQLEANMGTVNMVLNSIQPAR